MEKPAGWSSEATAEGYARFARSFPMYRRTSEELVDRLSLSGTERVLDLCAGTGVTTDVVLERLGTDGRVVALDQSTEMLAAARRQVDDPRVEWIEGRAEEADQLVPGPVDAVVCNSAIWQTDLARTFTAVAAVLLPGGWFVSNIGRQFLVMPFSEAELTNTTPGLIQLMTAYAATELNYSPPLGGMRGGPPLTPERVNDALHAAGLVPDPPEVVVHEQGVDEQAAWLRIPIFTERLLPGLPYELRMSVLDKALAKVDRASAPGETRWVIFRARKPTG